ncbi:MAG: DUF4382 domain-containing protein [Pseudomonadota bacterium]
MNPYRLVASSLLACGVLLGTGCGGGGGSGNPTPDASSRGSLSVSLAAGAALDVQHVWVTLGAVALHTDADRLWSGGDSSWQVVRFSQPVTLDLTTLNNGTQLPLMIGHALPAGRYGQLRLFLLAHDAPLADSARTLQLAHNAQVDYADAAGTARQVPLELPDASLGLRIDGPIDVPANEHAEVALQWDLERSLVRLGSDDGIDRFTLRPDLRWYDVRNTGAIVGVLDRSQFCAPGVRGGDCIHDAVASALLPSADGRFKRSMRTSPVLVGTQYATFSLYPLPALAAGQTFDVVIRGRNMRTMVVRHVPAQPAGLLEALPTRLGADPNDPTTPAPMVPVLQPQAAARVSLSQPMAHTGARLLFGQTLPGDSAPLEIAGANVDPFSGLLAQPAVLPGGPLRVAEYRSDAVLSFADFTPQEGQQVFSAMALGTRYDEPSATIALAAPPGNVSFVAPEPGARAGLGSGTLAVTLAAAPASRYDAAELVVWDANGIVTTRDLSAGLAGGTVVELALPAGAEAAALGGTAVYAVAVRAWRRDAPAATLRWARASGVVDLRNASTASAALALP